MRRLFTSSIVALAVVAVAGCSSSSDAPKVLNTTIVVAGGQPQGGAKTLKVKQGGIVKLTIQSDTADEVHIHGYDLHKDVAKGGSVVFDFQAKDAGKFEIELEAAKLHLASLLVEP